MVLLVASMIMLVLMFLLAGAFMSCDGGFLFGSIIALHGVLFLFVALGVRSDESYKQGQIDAANGKQKYHLIINKSEVWELKEE